MIPLHCYNVSIAAAVAVKPSTIYSVKIDNHITGQSWCVRRCYSDFYALRSSLIAALQHNQMFEVVHPLIFKLFPRRSLFGSRRNSVVKYRVVALQQFLRAALACTNSAEVRKMTKIKQAMTASMESFLACPQASRQLGKTCLPLRPSGRLLAGMLLANDYQENCSETETEDSSVYGDDWSIAGDAVGLWAASNSACQEKTPALRRLASNPSSTPQGQQPMVFREMILGR